MDILTSLILLLQKLMLSRYLTCIFALSRKFLMVDLNTILIYGNV